MKSQCHSVCSDVGGAVLESVPWHFCSDAVQLASRRQRCEQFLVGGSMEYKGDSVPASVDVYAGPSTEYPTWCSLLLYCRATSIPHSDPVSQDGLQSTAVECPKDVRVQSCPPRAFPQEMEAFLITAVGMSQVTVWERCTARCLTDYLYSHAVDVEGVKGWWGHTWRNRQPTPSSSWRWERGCCLHNTASDLYTVSSLWIISPFTSVVGVLGPNTLRGFPGHSTWTPVSVRSW